MSLTRDGIWKGGVWASTVWAQDVWYETAAASGGGNGGSIRQVFYNFADHLNKNLTSNYYVVHYGRFGVSAATAVVKFRGLLINVGRFMT